MSVLYTTCSGQSSTSASRRGSKNSGVRASIQSYKGSVICSMNYSEDEKMPIVIISHHAGKNQQCHNDSFYHNDTSFFFLLSIVAGKVYFCKAK